MQVADGVYRLTGGVCNFYLIEDGGKLVLVDAGEPHDWACWSAPWRAWVTGSTAWMPC